MTNEYAKLRGALAVIMHMNDVEFNALFEEADNIEGNETDDVVWSILKEEKDLRETDGFVCRTVEQLEYRGLFESV